MVGAWSNPFVEYQGTKTSQQRLVINAQTCSSCMMLVYCVDDHVMQTHVRVQSRRWGVENHTQSPVTRNTRLEAMVSKKEKLYISDMIR